MTAFVVYGCSYAKCLTKARRDLPTLMLLPDDWESKCHKYAGELYETVKPSRLSKKFGAPQFCKDFMALCDPVNFKHLSIRAYQKTGKPVMKGKKKGMDAYGWLPYEPKPDRFNSGDLIASMHRSR